jgi:hypothetical protein
LKFEYRNPKTENSTLNTQHSTLASRLGATDSVGREPVSARPAPIDGREGCG